MRGRAAEARSRKSRGWRSRRRRKSNKASATSRICARTICARAAPAGSCRSACGSPSARSTPAMRNAEPSTATERLRRLVDVDDDAGPARQAVEPDALQRRAQHRGSSPRAIIADRRIASNSRAPRQLPHDAVSAVEGSLEPSLPRSAARSRCASALTATCDGAGVVRRSPGVNVVARRQRPAGFRPALHRGSASAIGAAPGIGGSGPSCTTILVSRTACACAPARTASRHGRAQPHAAVRGGVAEIVGFHGAVHGVAAVEEHRPRHRRHARTGANTNAARAGSGGSCRPAFRGRAARWTPASDRLPCRRSSPTGAAAIC